MESKEFDKDKHARRENGCWVGLTLLVLFMFCGNASAYAIYSEKAIVNIQNISATNYIDAPLLKQGGRTLNATIVALIPTTTTSTTTTSTTTTTTLYVETDPIAGAKIGTLTSGNFCKGTGTQVSCTDSNTYLTAEVDGSTTNEIQNIFQSLTGNSGTSTADTSTDSVQLLGAGIVGVVCADTPDVCTITGTEVDGSTTNEIQNIFQNVISSPASETATADTSTDTFTLAGAGINAVTCSAAGDSCTITGTEVGDISAVTAGNGLTGGGTTGAVTLAMANDVRITGSLQAATLNATTKVNTPAVTDATSITLTGGTGIVKQGGNTFKMWSTDQTNSSEATSALWAYDYHGNANIRGALLGMTGSKYTVGTGLDYVNLVYRGVYSGTRPGYLGIEGPTGFLGLIPGTNNAFDLGSSTNKWKNGYIVNAWTVGDLVFNYNNANYRIIEAEKLTNDKLKGLMYVMGDKAVMWIEPDGQLHTTKEIDTKWEGISGLSFDTDGGVYKDNQTVRYPVVGNGNETYLSPVYKNKTEYLGDKDINKVEEKPKQYLEVVDSSGIAQTTTAKGEVILEG